MESIRRAMLRRSGLWRSQDFINFWSGETIANFGGQIGLVAMPLIAAVTLHASPFEMGLLAASGTLPRMVVGVFAGTWVDHRKRRPIMIIINVSRMLLYAVIPLSAAVGLLSYGLLLVLSLLAGALGIVFDSAWSAMVPTLVNRDDLADANGKLWASMSLAQITGPAIAGTLIAWLGGPYVMAVTALTFGISVWFLRRIRKAEPQPETPAHGGPAVMLNTIREGFHELVRSPVVRPLTTSMITIMFGAAIFSSVYVLFLTDTLGLATNKVGMIFAVGGVGALAGSMVAAPAAKRYGVGPVILWAALIHGVANFLIPGATLVGPLWLLPLLAGEVAAWVAFQTYDINRFSLRQSMTRPNLMGRVASSTMTIASAASMVGALLGGTIGQLYGIQAALVVGSIMMLAGAVFVWRSPIPQMRHLAPPAEVDPLPAEPVTAATEQTVA